MTDRKTNDRFRNRFRRPRDGRTGRYTAHETDAHDAEEDPNSEEEDSCEEESDLTAAFEREMDELASVVEELEDTLDVQGVKDLREFSESMYEGLATILIGGENEESRLPASRQSSMSSTGREEARNSLFRVQPFWTLVW